MPSEFVDQRPKKDRMPKCFTIMSPIVLVILTPGCDKPDCHNTNPTFEQFDPHSKEYKDELVRQLTNTERSKLSYWMDTYQEDNGVQSLLVDVQGSGLCAKMSLVIKNTDVGIEDILRTKGVGYQGAELQNLRFDIRQDEVSTEFVFKTVDGIRD